MRRSAGTLVRIGVLGALAGVWGCGHANAPCPTPTSLLDEHRGQSEARQRDLARATDQADAMEARRDEALRRIQAAKALEDSLASRPAVTGGRKGRR